MKTEEKDLLVVGTISGAHGVRGEVRVRSFTEDPPDLFTFGVLYGKNGTPLLNTQNADTEEAVATSPA